VRDLHERLNAAVLPSEIAEEKRQEERFKALARGEFPD
jgi:hypothetical protein